MREGYTDDQIKLVIWDRNKRWNKPPAPGSDKDSREWLRPSTLFRPKFVEYLSMAEKSKKEYMKQRKAEDLGDVANKFRGRK